MKPLPIPSFCSTNLQMTESSVQSTLKSTSRHVHVQSSQHQKSACVSRCSVNLSRWRKIENRSIYFLTCPSKSAFSSCHRPLRMAPKLFAVAEIRSRISSVSSGRLCVFFATQLKPCLAFSLFNSKKGEK